MRSAITKKTSTADCIRLDIQHQSSRKREGQTQPTRHSSGVSSFVQCSGSPETRAFVSTASPLAGPLRQSRLRHAHASSMCTKMPESFAWAHWSSEQAKRCRYNRPLLLLDLSTKADSPILVPVVDYLRNSSGSIYDEEIHKSAAQNKDCYLFDCDFTSSPRKIATEWIFDGIHGLHFFDTIFNTWTVQYDRQFFVEQVKLAGLLWNGLLGDPDQALAKKIMKGVCPEMRDVAIRQALCHSSGQKGAMLVPTLLSWGADINATSDDDDWTSLMSACVRRDLPMVEVLVRHGANLHDEFGAHESIVDLLEDEEWKDLAPLIETWKNQPLITPENELEGGCQRQDQM